MYFACCSAECLFPLFYGPITCCLRLTLQAWWKAWRQARDALQFNKANEWFEPENTYSERYTYIYTYTYIHVYIYYNIYINTYIHLAVGH